MQDTYIAVNLLLMLMLALEVGGGAATGASNISTKLSGNIPRSPSSDPSLQPTSTCPRDNTNKCVYCIVCPMPSSPRQAKSNTPPAVSYTLYSIIQHPVTLFHYPRRVEGNTNSKLLTRAKPLDLHTHAHTYTQTDIGTLEMHNMPCTVNMSLSVINKQLSRLCIRQLHHVEGTTVVDMPT